MNRQEAELLKDKKVEPRLLIAITDSVVNEVLYTLREVDSSFSEDVRYLLYKRENINEENMNIFKDKIFEAIRESFTLPQLKILEKSNEDSGNYHLMYKKLFKYFQGKLFDAGRTGPALFVEINDDETYATIFNQMTEFVNAPQLKRPTRLNKTERKQGIDYEKIQERFEQ